jgi:hypothetical protein
MRPAKLLVTEPVMATLPPLLLFGRAQPRSRRAFRHLHGQCVRALRAPHGHCSITVAYAPSRDEDVGRLSSEESVPAGGRG